MSHTSAAAVTLAGTPTHIPPEKWKNHNMESEVKFDVYSFGIMLWELFTNKQAFSSSSPGYFEPPCSWKFVLYIKTIHQFLGSDSPTDLVELVIRSGDLA